MICSQVTLNSEMGKWGSAVTEAMSNKSIDSSFEFSSREIGTNRTKVAKKMHP